MTEQTHEQTLKVMIAELWVRSRHTFAERAALLQAAGDQWARHSLDETTRLSAVDAAHKLAGVLGTFGLPRGTTLALEAEQLFGRATDPSEGELVHLRGLLDDLALLIDAGPVKL